MTTETTLERHAFFSPAWFDMASGQLQAALSERLAQRFEPLVLIERFIDAPPLGLVEPCSITGLRLEVDGGTAQLRRGLRPGERGHVVIVTHWDDAARAAQMTAGESLAEFGAWRVEAGRHSQEGTLPPAVAELLKDVHDRIAWRTCAPGVHVESRTGSPA